MSHHQCYCCYSHFPRRLAHNDCCTERVASTWYSHRNNYPGSRTAGQLRQPFAVHHDYCCANASVRRRCLLRSSFVGCQNVVRIRSTNASDCHYSNRNCSISTLTPLQLDRCTAYDCHRHACCAPKRFLHQIHRLRPYGHHSTNLFVDFVAQPPSSWHRHRRWFADFANEANSLDPTKIECDAMTF